MKTDKIWLQEALRVIHKACTPHGILASAQNVDNYQRVFSRDAVMTGLAGLLVGDDRIIAAFRASLINLAKAQGGAGQIPSNIGMNDSGERIVSYGGLAGRVDATTWWIIGASILVNVRNDAELKSLFEPVAERAFAALRTWEFNERGLLYIPLSGNWADEYIVQGCTLYDQLLRLWALRAAYTIWRQEEWQQGAARLTELIRLNYRKTSLLGERYHPTAYKRMLEQPSPFNFSSSGTEQGEYWWCSLSPNGYDTRWDMAANALALLLGIGTNEENTATNNFLHVLAKAQGSWLLPVFAPVITPESPDWHLLQGNCTYRFKNEPHHFHNGGCWFIFMGWMSLALAKQGFRETSQMLYSTMTAALSEESTPYTFFEYVNPQTRIAAGTPQLCFTASGMILAEYAIGKQEEINSTLSTFAL